MKKLLNIVIIGSLFVVSPVVMDHARDIYLEKVVSPKAMPVKIGERTIASSFQVDWKGKRVTVTNNHVCSVVASIARRKDQKNFRNQMKFLKKYLGKGSLFNFIYNTGYNSLMKKKYPIEGETLKIGDTNRKILYNSVNHDICFLEPVGSKSFSLASSVNRGEKITIIGHPRGVPQSISEGRIVGEAYYKFPWIKQAGKVRYLRSTAITYPGNSGSPVINRYGNVVGILFAGQSMDYINVNCVVPLEYIESELITYFNQK